MFGIGMIEELFPKELLSTYRAQGAYSSRLVPVANKFSDWFSVSGIPFFKFYTDHSENHSFEVFQTAIEFMSPEAHKFVSAQDLSLLFVACFCHDSGMHLTELQFQKLIAATNNGVLCSLDRDSWYTLWINFMEEAQRFNQQTLIAIFGDTKPIEPPPTDVQDFTDRHRQLIGEFLRRHHPRLAHDLCLGLDKVLDLPDLFYDFKETERAIIGLISRSHGLGLRELFNYIEADFNLRDFNGIHIVYLMILLRLADYAQIQPHRASLTKARIHKIKSPISAREWRVHNSIKNITRTHDDPESIFIDSVPNNVGDFLRVKDWLCDLQSELDKSWAILGEIYGRQHQTGLDKLTLSIRRVRSSILDGGKTFDFIAERVRFRVAESEMLLLLLAPLYGDHPGYGVRELLQNAHDAVQEAIHLKAEHLLGEKPAVTITINCGPSKSYFEIGDNGVGMTSDVIIHYFLNAGASFRASSEWKKKFLDKSGKSEIVRSGRFGVGLLAAFLIGDKITVSTRHYLSDEVGGLTFDARLDQPEIEIRRCSRTVGTNIVIEIPKKNHDVLLKWANIMSELFSFDPNIIFNVKVVSENRANDISLNAAGDNGIFKFATEQYAEIRVSTIGRYERGLNFINGIAVGEYDTDRPNVRSDSSLYRSLALTERPKQISLWRYDTNLFEKQDVLLRITDKNCVCPLNLSRTKFDRTDETITIRINDFIIDSIIIIFNQIFNNSFDFESINECRKNCIIAPNKTAFVSIVIVAFVRVMLTL